MLQNVSRERLESFHAKLRELRKREERVLQSTRGWYDDDGVLQGGLMAFIRRFWHILEPEAQLMEGWALYAICQHLEAVTFGEIKRLLITVPPGFMKSLCTDVFHPAWEWGPAGLSHMRYCSFAYSASLTERDNERFRDLICHQEYQEMWGKTVKPVKIGATKVSNTRKGWKLASSVGGVGTGERGDRVIIDDAHNIKEAESDVVREETVRWFRESISDRLNNLETGTIVVIMQRAHDEDVAGAILSLGLPYTHLMIDMKLDRMMHLDNQGQPIVTSIGWVDPRVLDNSPDGTLAWPERFPKQQVIDIEHVKGPVAFSGQYMQRPVPRGKGIFNRTWWQLWEPADGKFPAFDFILVSADTAFTDKEQNDPTGCTVWGVFRLPYQVLVGTKMVTDPNGGQVRVMLISAWRKHLTFSGVRMENGINESAAQFRLRTQPSWGLVEWLQDTCLRFKADKLLIEAKASGISAADEIRNRFGRQPYSVEARTVQGDKTARALAVQPTFSQGVVYAPDRDWADMVITEAESFPLGKYKDLTDSMTQALKYMRDQGLLETDEERAAAQLDAISHRSPMPALYPTMRA